MAKTICDAITKESKCAVCNIKFKVKRPWQLFCGHECRNIWHSAARDQGVEMLRELTLDPSKAFTGKSILARHKSIIKAKLAKRESERTN